MRRMCQGNILHLRSVFFWGAENAISTFVADTLPKINSRHFFPQAPCRAELQRALDRLASNTRTHDDLFTIPIPNCDKNGDFHAKQVCGCMHTLVMSFNSALEGGLHQRGRGTSDCFLSKTKLSPCKRRVGGINLKCLP